MKAIAVKIGSSVLLTQRNKLDEFRIAHIADQVLSLRAKGMGTILVISGAVACGANYIDISSGNKELKRLAAGIGQANVISTFYHIFSKKHLLIAQVLFTRNCLDSAYRKEDMSQLLNSYLQRGITPVVNENDVIDLNSFGGNDYLVVDIASLLSVQKVLILSTMERSPYGVGGGATKEKALQLLRKKGFEANIVDGKEQNIIFENSL